MRAAPGRSEGKGFGVEGAVGRMVRFVRSDARAEGELGLRWVMPRAAKASARVA